MNFLPRKKYGGRVKGVKNKRSKQKLIAEAAEKAQELLGDQEGIFEGNALAYLMSIYKNPAYDTYVRMDAAKTAINFESPRLAATVVNHSGSVTLESLVMEAIKLANPSEDDLKTIPNAGIVDHQSFSGEWNETVTQESQSVS